MYKSVAHNNCLILAPFSNTHNVNTEKINIEKVSDFAVTKDFEYIFCILFFLNEDLFANTCYKI